MLRVVGSSKMGYCTVTAGSSAGTSSAAETGSSAEAASSAGAPASAGAASSAGAAASAGAASAGALSLAAGAAAVPPHPAKTAVSIARHSRIHRIFFMVHPPLIWFSPRYHNRIVSAVPQVLKTDSDISILYNYSPLFRSFYMNSKQTGPFAGPDLKKDANPAYCSYFGHSFPCGICYNPNRRRMRYERSVPVNAESKPDIHL